MLSSQLIQQLQSFGSATVYEAQGGKGALAGYIKPIDPGMSVVGPALTLDIKPGDNLMLHYALTKAKAGDVLVVDAKGFTEAGPWGDILTLAALHLGLAGLIIDGAVRDAAGIVESGFPVFCRGLSIKGTTKNQPGKINVPLDLAGCRIHPGDIVVGDRDGVAVIAQGELMDTVRLCEERCRREASQRDDIKQGKTTAQLLGLSAKFAELGLT